MSEWKPIETAPKDGKEVLACFVGQFSRHIVFVAHANQDGVHAPGYGKPSHWMPLPEPPKETEK